MKLTGKCKESFEEWFIDWVFRNALNEYRIPKKERMELFYSLPLSMQYGVLVDFFDSVGLIVENKKSISAYSYYVTNTPKYFQSFLAKTRHEARTKAIEKANEIFNK